MKRIICYWILLFTLYSCTEKKLPVLGNYSIENGDTIYAKIPDFNLWTQDSMPFTSQMLENKIHVAAFFFTSCPTICPKVMRNMMRIEEKFSKEKDILYLCYSLDFKKDSIPRLKEYASKLGIENSNFYFLQGRQKEDIRSLMNAYMSIAVDDPDSPGGINHSGWILLIDGKKNLRSYCLGTDEKETDKLIKDIQTLLHERD
jgi:protein SCO1/2